jgi:hypothetical protein
VELDHNSPDPHCARCRENGVPQPKFLTLTLRHRKVAECLLGASNPAEGVRNAAKATGFSEVYIRHLREGRRLPEFRRFYQMYLEQAGGDIARVAQVQVACMNEATEQKYHPKAEVFVEFPDWRTRLRASQHIGKMLEMEPPKAEGGVSVGVAIKIETNLGTGETVDPPSVFRAKPLIESLGDGE